GGERDGFGEQEPGPPLGVEAVHEDRDGAAEGSADAGDGVEAEVVEDLEDVDGKVFEPVGVGVDGCGAAAVAAQVDGDGSGGHPDEMGDGFVETAAEAVGVQEDDGWAGPAPVEGADGGAGVAGEVEDLG